MASEFLKSYGISLDSILAETHLDDSSSSLDLPKPEPVAILHSILLPSSPNTLHDLTIDLRNGTIQSITPAKQPSPSSLPFCPSAAQTLVLPSLCHPHLHLDKPYLLSHPQTSHLTPTTGTFSEALSLTAEAKKLYTSESLLERGNWLIADSVRAGVTHMRAYVEVDETVGFKCVDAGLELKRMWKGRCEVQICVFAQDPVFSGEHAQGNRELIEEAVRKDGVEVLGSTPYVEANADRARSNIEWAVELAIEHGKYLDFHLDYNLDKAKDAQVWDVIEVLEDNFWNIRNEKKTVCLGHCTRLALFSRAEWRYLSEAISAARLPIYFVGLPTSDVFMQGRPEEGDEARDRPRGTLQLPWMIEKLGLNAALSLNNVGNAFTPQGSADPLSVASLGCGLYQVGTVRQAECLYVSTEFSSAQPMSPARRAAIPTLSGYRCSSDSAYLPLLVHCLSI